MMSEMDNDTIDSMEREEEIEERYTTNITGNADNLEQSNTIKIRGKRDLRTPRQKYCERWEIDFPWLKADKIDDSLGICTICDRRLVCKKSHLERHQNSFKHQRNSGFDPDTKPDNLFAVFIDNEEEKRESDDYEFEHLESDDYSSTVKTELKPKIKKQPPPPPPTSIESPVPVSMAKREIIKRPIERIQKIQKVKLDRYNLLKRIDRDRNELNEYYYRNQKEMSMQHMSPPKNQNQQQQRDSFDLFFESVSASVKALPPKLSYEVKSKISQLLSEFELRALCEKEAIERASREGTTLEPVLVNPSFEDQKEMQVTTSIDASMPHLVYTFQQKTQ